MQGQASAVQSFRRTGPPFPVEIGFLADWGYPAGLLFDAAALAVKAGVSADRILIAHQLIGEDLFYRALADEVGLRFVADPVVSRDAIFPNSILAGLAPVEGAPHRFVTAPRGTQIARLLAARPARSGLAITTPTALTRAVLRARRATIAHEAAFQLVDHCPQLSARDGGSIGQYAVLGLLLGFLSFCGTLAADTTFGLLGGGLGPLFLGMVLLRLGTTFIDAPITPSRRPPRADDAMLPVYSVIVALYRETRVVRRLVDALRRIDYPVAKLDIKLVLEADDPETLGALAALDLPAFMEVIIAPPGEPRTKPRALNVALPLVRGQFTVIYDAEDVPDRDQLRLAVASFSRQTADVACLQARLAVDNPTDSWITRCFAIEYASLFDVINPGLAALELPIPLGGTSNHFRTSILRQIRGWDAWNVTEDADLGIRLARLGYRTADLPSSTFEEAPLTLRAWMRQRTRWMKGYFQTCGTHLREPVLAFRQLGPLKFYGAVTMTFGTVLSALGYPAFSAIAMLGLGHGAFLPAGGILAAIWSFGSLTLFVSGLAAMFVPACIALKRRGWWHLLPWVPLLPLYYALVSVAAWRGLWELAKDPFRWNKTDHGLARTSRVGVLKAVSRDRAPPPRAVA